jgi:shikimate kinase
MIDLDRRVADVFGVALTDLFAHGEVEFRARERTALVSLVAEPGFVTRSVFVATGGGTVIDPANRASMRVGQVVLLHVPLAVLAQRLAHDDRRPLLQGGDRLARLHELWSVRESAYRDGAIVVDADAPVDEVAARVREAVGA